MALPPGITKKLLQATSDKTDLNKQALRFNRSFKEVGKLLAPVQPRPKKIRIKNNLPKEDTSAPAACFSQEQTAGDAGIPKKAHLKTMNPPAKNFPKIFSRKVLTFCFLGDIMANVLLRQSHNKMKKNAPLAQLVEQ